MKLSRVVVVVIIIITCNVWTATARAGGFELPGNDAEALARGGAFTAKADDGAALDYNVAGLARQRLFCRALAHHSFR